MFAACQLFRHSFQSKLRDERNQEQELSTVSAISGSNPEKDLAVVVWWAAFGVSLFFRPIFEVATRVLVVMIVVQSFAAVDGLLNLVLGSAVLKAVHSRGYDAPVLWTAQAGILGGITVTGPCMIAWLSAVPVAIRGDVARSISDSVQNTVAMLALVIAMSVAMSAAASTTGVLIVRRIHYDTQEVLDAVHAARAGALGTSVTAVLGVFVTLATLSRARSQRPRREIESTAPISIPAPATHPCNPSNSTNAIRDNVALCTAAKITYYSLAIICVLTIRLLCF